MDWTYKLIDRDVIAELVLELGGVVSRTVHLSPTVACRGYRVRSMCGNWANRSRACLPMIPVMTQPMVLVMGKMCVTEDASTSLSAIFFCVTTTATPSPRMPTLVTLLVLIALNAYSACHNINFVTEWFSETINTSTSQPDAAIDVK